MTEVCLRTQTKKMSDTPQCQSWPEPSVHPGKGNTTNIIKQK